MDCDHPHKFSSEYIVDSDWCFDNLNSSHHLFDWKINYPGESHYLFNSDNDYCAGLMLICQSESTTVQFRTTLTQTIIFHLLMAFKYHEVQTRFHEVLYRTEPTTYHLQIWARNGFEMQLNLPWVTCHPWDQRKCLLKRGVRLNVACMTGALWAKRGKCDISRRARHEHEARDEGKRKIKRLFAVHCSSCSTHKY